MRNLNIVHNGKVVYTLNRRLLNNQKCWHNLQKLKAMHKTKLDIFDEILKETNPEVLKSYVQDLQLCEFELQKLWLFREDSRFDKWWKTPKCICAKLDNDDSYPSGHYSLNGSCILHGWFN